MLSIKNPFDYKKTKQTHEETRKTVSSSNDSSDYSDSDDPVTDDEVAEVTEPSDEDDDSSLEQDKPHKMHHKRNMFSVALLIAKSRRNGDNSFKTPMLTNTTLNIMRLFGKYIQMLSIFRIISNDVISYLMQLFYFYFYYIYMHFYINFVDNSLFSDLLRNLILLDF